MVKICVDCRSEIIRWTISRLIVAGFGMWLKYTSDQYYLHGSSHSFIEDRFSHLFGSFGTVTILLILFDGFVRQPTRIVFRLLRRRTSRNAILIIAKKCWFC